MNKFIEECEKIADELGLEIIDTYSDGTKDDVFTDDGTLHIVRGKVRVAFDVSNNQNLNAKAEAKNIKAVLKALGRGKAKSTPQS